MGVNKDENAVKYGDLTVYVSNGFPLDAKIQLYIMDKNNVIIDSIAQNGHLLSAQVDVNNIVVNPTKSTLKFNIPRYKMALLEKNSRVLLKVKLNTNNAPHTTIYKDYKMEIQLVGDFNLDVSYK